MDQRAKICICSRSKDTQRIHLAGLVNKASLKGHTALAKPWNWKHNKNKIKAQLFLQLLPIFNTHLLSPFSVPLIVSGLHKNSICECKSKYKLHTYGSMCELTLVTQSMTVWIYWSQKTLFLYILCKTLKIYGLYLDTYSYPLSICCPFWTDMEVEHKTLLK